ncbi:RNA polymerase sigma factor [Saccharibacillus brassicae]|uniref:Sigma-70 family RNA polymerase sigma factor n=1 Tax=Saccharibacillus brassicae TaxID=2583377 RepID=A0A4Y6V0T5_SACBS|nr:sigma-70 family RNA polymerase sigma factor [Saccharibacillus brassicae]QDH21885.1 sigma-70 family RNA polymerase sigma factor [Saccharibacillus brassicae]
MEKTFAALIREHGAALSAYCRFLTGCKSESEDLLQETWLKAWTAYGAKERTWNRAYLRSIAYHAWIDRVRKVREESGYEADEEATTSEEDDPLRLWAAAERIVRLLTPEQRTVYLLMEYMRFTASETAALLRTTEGGVKASLHRARKKLGAQHRERIEECSGLHGEERVQPEESTVFAYLEAIRLQDVRALLVLRNGGSAEDAAIAVRCAGNGGAGRSAADAERRVPAAPVSSLARSRAA